MTAKAGSAPVFGCTCGECTDVWLSPRMRYRLLSEADGAVDMMKMSLESPLASDLECAPGTEYLSQSIQNQGITRKFYVGYTAIVMVIAKLLKQPGDAGVPSVTNIDAMLGRISISQHTAVFFDRGGRVRNAIDFILYSAKDQSPLGDGTWDEMRVEGAEDEDGLGEEYGKLPRCANDLDFMLVEAGLAD
ncbi:hypothetical protein L226DRAFT_567397 [Lentinus tigrinus ALCF2SS1-7]|uniref:Uncharacterized protein n=1 Tax=Lentinus tigrinus ALCF2SS1-6 TaxID=1328759 RepID=A0A5C2SPU0_9APHY|nr:hypothetical protein L227DRAFT_649477 [Lentinus tigrinus ALCF2SS1-6]RPD79236.1 hypothetical protein L226DRAFT_567397 [Lentinus tigrinus ALCF2SS1-7]